MKQQSLITNKQRQLINHEHHSRMDKLRRQREIIQLQSHCNKQNLEMNVRCIARINQDQQFKKHKLDSIDATSKVIPKQTIGSIFLKSSFGRNQINHNDIPKKLGEQVPMSNSRAFPNQSSVINNSRWKGKFHQAQSFEAPKQVQKLSYASHTNPGYSFVGEAKMKESLAAKCARSIMVNPGIENLGINMDTPRDHLSSLNKYKTPRTGPNLQTRKQVIQEAEYLAINSGLKPSVPFNQQLSSNICNKWIYADITTNPKTFEIQQQKRKSETSLREQLQLRNAQREMRDQLFNDKLASRYGRQLIAHRESLKNASNAERHSSPKFEAYIPFQQHQKNKEQITKRNKNLSDRKSVSFDGAKNRCNSNGFRHSSKGNKSKHSSRSRSNYQSSTISSNNKRRCKFDRSESKEPSQTMKKIKKQKKQKNKLLHKPSKPMAMVTKTKKAKKNTVSNKNRSIMPSCRNSVSKYKSTTPKSRPIRRKSFAPYFFDQQARSAKKTPKCNLDYKAYQQLGQKKINNRFAFSQAVYQDSKFKNIKHQIDHLFNVYNNQKQLRRDVRIKLGTVPQVMKKHNFVC